MKWGVCTMVNERVFGGIQGTALQNMQERYSCVVCRSRRQLYLVMNSFPLTTRTPYRWWPPELCYVQWTRGRWKRYVHSCNVGPVRGLYYVMVFVWIFPFNTHVPFPWRYRSPCLTNMGDIGSYCKPICSSGPFLSMTPAPHPAPAIRKSVSCLFTVQLSLFYLTHHLHMPLSNWSFGDMFPYVLLEYRSCASINPVGLIRWCHYMGESSCSLPIANKVSFSFVFLMLINVCASEDSFCYSYCYL